MLRGKLMAGAGASAYALRTGILLEKLLQLPLSVTVQ